MKILFATLFFLSQGAFAQELPPETKQMMQEQGAIQQKYAKEDLLAEQELDAKKNELERKLNAEVAELNRQYTSKMLSAAQLSAGTYSQTVASYLPIAKVQNKYQYKDLPELILAYDKKYKEREDRRMVEETILGLKYFKATTPEEVKAKNIAEKVNKIDSEYRKKSNELESKKRQEIIDQEYIINEKISELSTKQQEVIIKLQEKATESGKISNYLEDKNYIRLDKQKIEQQTLLQKKIDDINRKYDTQNGMLDIEKSGKINAFSY